MRQPEGFEDGSGRVCRLRKSLYGLKQASRTAEYSLKFSAGTKFDIVGYCDSDYAGDLEERKSTSGCVFMVGGSVVSWRSERQFVVATSTTEAEYIAAAEAVKELIWLRRLFEEITGDKVCALCGQPKRDETDW